MSAEQQDRADLLDYLANYEAATRANKGVVEVEARFRLTKHQFYQSLETLRKARRVRLISVSDERRGDVRHRRIYSVTQPTPNTYQLSAEPVQEEWIEKRREGQPYDSREFNFRVAVATEVTVSPDLKRAVTHRTTTLRYLIDVSNTLRVEFIRDREQKEYRLELELLPGGDATAFVNYVFRLVSLVQESLLPVGASERAKVIRQYNQLLGVDNDTAFANANLPHPEDITQQDLLRGRLLESGGNSVTAKADGDIISLLFFDSGVYTVSGRNQINKLLAKRVPQLVPAIFHGEQVQLKAEPGTHAVVLIDTLFVAGFDYRPEPSLVKRHEHHDAIVSLFSQSSLLRVLSKNFDTFTTADEQYELTHRQYQQLANLPYATDGLIYTPINRPYRQGEIAIRKAKQREQLTIDFEIGENALLISNDEKNYASEPFTGSGHARLNLSTQQFKTMFAATEFMEVGDVWEFRITEELRPEPVRARRRKQGGNKLSTANNIWALITRPIAASTLTGRDMELVKRYHNVEKSADLDSLPDQATILDLGSGRGGDILKWMRKRFKTYLLEPDADNRTELTKRIKENKFSGNVLGLADYGAEETERVLQELLKGQQVDAVTMMLALTFFYRDSAMLDALVATVTAAVKPTGTIIFTTADGERVTEQMRGAGQLVSEHYSYTRQAGRELLVHIKDSIVTEQREWLTDLVELDVRMRRKGFIRTSYRVFDKVDQLPRHQRVFSKMYVSLQYERADKPVVPRPVISSSVVPVTRPVATSSSGSRPAPARAPARVETRPVSSSAASSSNRPAPARVETRPVSSSSASSSSQRLPARAPARVEPRPVSSSSASSSSQRLPARAPARVEPRPTSSTSSNVKPQPARPVTSIVTTNSSSSQSQAPPPTTTDTDKVPTAPARPPPRLINPADVMSRL